MKLPNMPRKGESVAESVRDIIRYLKSVTVTGVSGGRVQQTPNGTTIAIDQAPSRRMAKRLVNFEIYGLALDDVNGIWKCSVWPGHVLNIDPKYGVTEPLKYWLAPEFATPPGEPTEFTVSDTLRIFAKVDTTSKDIVTAVTIVAVDDATAVNEHQQPPPSAAENGESPPPPLDGVYYYKIADFRFEGDVLVVDKQYHLGGPIIHRPALPEFYNIPETGGVGYEVVKHWVAAESRYEFRQIVQLNETYGVEVLKPYAGGEPPYEQIPVRRVRERVSGDDASTATTQIHVDASSSGNGIVIKGNSAVGQLTVNGTPSGLEWDDGLVTTDGTVDIETGGGGINLNLHVRKQTEGTAGNEWVDTNISAKTLCFRDGALVGTITQSDPDALTEVCTGFEASAPGDLISVTCSDIDPVS